MRRFLFLLPMTLAAVVAQPETDAKNTFLAALDAAKTAQSADMGSVVTAVLNATDGDELAYYRLMQEATNSKHPVALTWSALQMLKQVQAQGLNPGTAPEARQLRSYIEEAARQGYVPALVEMANLHGNGIGGAVDEKKGMNYLMEACKANNPRARAVYLLLSGRLSAEGEPSPAVQAELKKNNYYVEEFMSLMTRQGSETKSKEWLSKAAEHGSPGAACTLAMFHMQEGDVARGYELLKKAVERDHPQALSQLATLTLPGTELPEALKGLVHQDTQQAIRLYQKAALLGDTAALMPLAGLYHQNPEKYTQERVFELYRRAADAGDARGGVAYAYCLVSGRGCAPEPERGVGILKKLTDAGVPNANVALAELYFNGVGVEPDMTSAISALSAAASSGMPQAYTLMAVISQLGNKSRESDPRRAQLYLRMAEERGEAAPRELFNSMVKNGVWKLLP